MDSTSVAERKEKFTKKKEESSDDKQRNKEGTILILRKPRKDLPALPCQVSAVDRFDGENWSLSCTGVGLWVGCSELFIFDFKTTEGPFVLWEAFPSQSKAVIGLWLFLSYCRTYPMRNEGEKKNGEALVKRYDCLRRQTHQ